MKRIIFFLLIFAFVGSISATTIHVPQGGDIALYIRQAREMHRLHEVGSQETINIVLDGDEYILSSPLYLRQEDSFLKISSPHSARISSKAVIRGWKKEGKFWVAEAPNAGTRPLRIRQLYVNGQKALRSTQFGNYEMQRMTDFRTKERSIIIPTPENLSQLQREDALEMLVHQRWAIAILRVKSIERCQDDPLQTQVTFLEPESELEFSHPWPQPVIGEEKGNSSFCLQNAKCLVDEQGEWYQDNDGRIWYLPKEGEKIEDTEIACATLEQLVEISGTATRAVHHITFENICFEYASWNRPSNFGHVTLQGGFLIVDAYKLGKEGLPWDKNLENQAWILRPVSAVTASWGQHINFYGCTFRHLSSTALDYSYAIKDCIVSNNRFEDIGGTAILGGWFGEGEEVHIPIRLPDAEYTTDLFIKGNTIYDATNEDWGAVGIGLGYVRSCHITENEVSKVNYSGICVGWGWTAGDTGMRDNHIVNNHITDFARMLYDAGGIYTLSNQPHSEIMGNTIEHLGKAPYATNDRGFYIYLDAKTDGYTISGNHCTEQRFGDNHPGKDIIWKENN